MQEVKQIETLINKFQNELRRNLQAKELSDYIANGHQIRTESEETWEKVFNDFKAKAEQEAKISESSTRKFNQILFEKNFEQIKKLKSTKIAYKINVIATQEKIVGLNERTEEAANLKAELCKLANEKEAFLAKEKAQKIQQLNCNLQKFQNFEKEKILNKTQRELNFLLIKKNKETNVLEKKTNLHIKDFETVQSEISQVYLNKGKKLEELHRAKIRQINTNRILTSAKSNISEDFFSKNNSSFNYNQQTGSGFGSTRASNFKGTVTECFLNANRTVGAGNGFSGESRGLCADYGLTLNCNASNSKYALVSEGFYHDLALALFNLPNNFSMLFDLSENLLCENNNSNLNSFNNTNNINSNYNNCNNNNNIKDDKNENNYLSVNSNNNNNSNFINNFNSNLAFGSNFTGLKNDNFNNKKENLPRIDSLKSTFNFNNNNNNNNFTNNGVLKALKFLQKHYNLPSWELNTESNSRTFCNVPEERKCPKTAGNESSKKVSKLQSKIKKMHDSRKRWDEVSIPITRFYDENLNEIGFNPEKKGFGNAKGVVDSKDNLPDYYCETEVKRKKFVKKIDVNV